MLQTLLERYYRSPDRLRPGSGVQPVFGPQPTFGPRGLRPWRECKDAGSLPEFEMGDEPMILGVGVDLCEIARIAQVCARTPRFLQRICTEAECERLSKRPAASVAGYFAAKEAVAKALGTGFRGFGFRDIEIFPDSLGKPHCIVRNGAEARMRALGGQTLMLSISHDGGMAMAYALLTDDPLPDVLLPHLESNHDQEEGKR